MSPILNPHGDPVADPIQTALSKAGMVHALDGFFTGKSPHSMRDVPWPIDPDMLAKHLRLKVRERQFTPDQGMRLLRLVNVYLLAPLAADAAFALERSEQSVEDVAISGSMCAVVGLVGQPPQITAAAEQYARLMRLPEADEALSYMLVARDALGPTVDSVQLGLRMQQRADRLLKQDDSAAQVEGRDLLGEKDNILQEIDWADETRTTVNKIGDPAKRLAALLDVYMEREDAYGEEYLVPWVVRAIRKIAHERGRSMVVAALRKEVAQTTPTRDDDSDAAFVGMRALRALLYFGATISEDDDAFCAAHFGDQMDPLSIDQMMPDESEDPQPINEDG